MTLQLVRKDMLYLFKSLKSTVITFVVFSMFMGMINTGITIVIPALACYIGLYSSIAYEERSKMNLLNVTLPVKRQEICLSKYVQAVLFVVIAALLGIVGMYIKQAVNPQEDVVAIGEVIRFIPIMISFGLIYSAVMLPCIFYYGCIKSRYVMLIIYGAIFGIAFSMGEDLTGGILASVQHMSLTTKSLFTLLVGMILFVISYMISLAIWNKKDF